MYELSPATTSHPALNPSASTEVIVLSFFFIWGLLGIIAFIYSLYCFTKRGSPIDKAVGLLLAMLTGPFFFLYLYVNRRYCK
jgi:hypothetical protein